MSVALLAPYFEHWFEIERTVFLELVCIAEFDPTERASCKLGYLRLEKTLARNHRDLQCLSSTRGVFDAVQVL